MNRVFLLEDSVYLHPCYIYPLKFENVEVIPFTDGKKMLDEITISEPELILLDYTFIGKDYTGFDIAKEIRNNNPDLPIIVVSGNLDNELENRFKEINVEEFIKKPFNTEELTSKTIQCLHKEEF